MWEVLVSNISEGIISTFNLLEDGHNINSFCIASYTNLGSKINVSIDVPDFKVNEDMTELPYTMTISYYNDLYFTDEQRKEKNAEVLFGVTEDYVADGGLVTPIREQSGVLHLTKQSGEWEITDLAQLGYLDIQEYRFPEFIMDAKYEME